MRLVALVTATAALAVGAGGAAGQSTDLFGVYPQAGILWRDLYPTNFVDLDPGPGLRDYTCAKQTYDGHTGTDTIVRSFREMDMGVPIFAATDGEVISVQDGEYDRNWGGYRRTPFDNHVVVQHGPGRFTIYRHLRKGITLRRGATVVAGQQLGWTASSGYSTWPHLHFTSQVDSLVVEPFAGPCREGESRWAEQVPWPTEPYARDLAISTKPFNGRASLPWDEAVRTATFVRGTREFHVRVQYGAAWNAERTTFRIVRPIGTDANRMSLPMAAPSGGEGQLLFVDRVDFDVTGRWRLTVDIDDTRVVDAPIRVVARESPVRNRAPSGVGVTLVPTSPPQCRIQTSLVTEDPDTDIVNYRYVWTVDGRRVRAVTSAALSDVLRRDRAGPGSRVTCTVTPSDGRLAGPSASATGTTEP